MKKYMVIFFAVLALIIIFVSCTSTIKTELSNSTQSAHPQMLVNKTLYVGDDTGASRFFNLIPSFDENYIPHKVAFHTNDEPCGYTIYFEPSENFNGENMQRTEEMVTYAGYQFDESEDLGYIEYAYRTTPSNDELVQPKYEILLKVDRPQ